VLLDGAADSTRALDGHFSLVTDYTFSTSPNRWACGKIPMDFRLGVHLESDPIDLVNIPDPEVEEQIQSLTFRQLTRRHSSNNRHFQC